MKKLLIAVLVWLVITTFIGCGSPRPSLAQPISPSTQPPSLPPPRTRTLVLGFVTNFGTTTGVQAMNMLNLLADMQNAKGGLKVGHDTYRLRFISYSYDNDINKGVSAINRLIYQDKVNFIIDQVDPSDIILPITDPAQVITFSDAAVWNSGLLDKWHYSFTLLGQSSDQTSVAGWLNATYPEVRGVNGLALAFPDNTIGHEKASLISAPYLALGDHPQIVYFPASQQDLSSLGTRIATVNPAWYLGNVGSAENIALADNAAYDAGYRGHYFHYMPLEVGRLIPVFKPGVLEGFICQDSAMEMNPQPTQLAVDIKDAYISRYGKWDYADYGTAPDYFALIQAIEAAGSINVDAVAKVLHHGLTFAIPDGSATMVTRPDMNTTGNTIDAVLDLYMKQIHNATPIEIAHISQQDELTYMRQAYPPLEPGQTPTIMTLR